MFLLRNLAVGIRALFRKQNTEREMNDELATYLDAAVKENLRSGMTPDEALRAAKVGLGSMEAVKENIRAAGWESHLEVLWQDLRYGLRMLRKNPGFTAVAVLTLALGIGANTALFSVVNVVLLRPLPYIQPDRLVSVVSTMLPANFDANASYPDFLDWRARNRVFEGIAAFDTRGFTLTGMGTALRVNGGVVSADIFRLLGVSPSLGRWFLPDEDKSGADNGTDAVIVSQGLWQRQFGSDPEVVGRTIQLNGKPFVIIGVMPGSFRFPPLPDSPELWTTVAVDAGAPGGGMTTERGAHYLDVIARLRPRVAAAQAEAEMKTIASDLNHQFPENHPRGAKVLPMSNELVQDVRPALLILLGAVGCVLLIGCANVANLLLARGTTRQREIAIRSALGASRWRMMRQVLTESMALACLGGAVGLLLAKWGIDFLVRLVPSGLPASEILLDGHVLAFTAAVSLFSGFLFGLVPSIQGSRTDLAEALKEGGRGASAGVHRSGIRSTLAVGEVAMALVLLVGAGLLMKSFMRLERVDPGFEADHALTFALQLPSTYKDAQRQEFFRQVVARIRSLPGVRSASAVTPLPLGGDEADCGFQIEGRPVPLASAPNTHYTVVEPDYFRTMGIPLLMGRDFMLREDLKTTPVVIINQTLAERFFPGQNPVGQRIQPGIGSGFSEPPMREIVGVVGDVKQVHIEGPKSAQAYVPVAQSPVDSMVIVARTATDPASIVSPAREQVKAIDKDVPVFAVKTLDEYVGDSVSKARFISRLLGAFAGLALVLAVVGIYGVISYSVTQRTHEIGVRVALGAGLGDVLKLVVGQGVRLSLAGIGIGVVAAFPIARLLRTLLFGVQPWDPVTFVLVAFVLCAAALLASYLPARRATKVDPIIVLRDE